MSGPKGMRRVSLANGQVHVFSDEERVVMQVRIQGLGHNPCDPWLKAGVQLDLRQALQVAGELLRAASELERTKMRTEKRNP